MWTQELVAYAHRRKLYNLYPPNAAPFSLHCATDHGADKVKDPTLPRATNTNCNMCGHNESVFFQAPLKGDEGMKLIFMCTNCAYKWKA